MNIKGLDGCWLDPLRWLEYLTQWTKNLDVSARLWYCQRGSKFNYQVIQGRQRGRNVKIWRKWVIVFCQDTFCSWWVVDQTPTCCPCSRGPYCRKQGLCCGPTMCHQRNVLLNTIADWLNIPTMTSMSIFMSWSIFQLWNVFDNGQHWFNVEKRLGVLLF